MNGLGFSGVVKYIEINASGLECCVQLDFGNIVGNLNCYVLLAKSYEPYCSANEVAVYVEDSEPTILKVEDTKEIGLSVVFGNSCSKINFGTQECVMQTLDKSSHTKFVATVKKIIDEYTIVCSIGKLGENILVEFEDEVNYLVEEDKIMFSGEIKGELIN